MRNWLERLVCRWTGEDNTVGDITIPCGASRRLFLHQDEIALPDLAGSGIGFKDYFQEIKSRSRNQLDLSLQTLGGLQCERLVAGSLQRS